jgi:S1-C subfamily serine protease/CheY-like chemotaxis protein
VLDAADGEAVLALARNERADLLLVDWNLRDRSAGDICRAVRADAEATKILLLAARTDALDEASARAAGADGSIKKPFSSLQLLKTVERLLGAEEQLPTDTALVRVLEQPTGGSKVRRSDTVGGRLRSQSRSAVHRLLIERSVRRATILGAAAFVVTALVGVLVAGNLLFFEHGKASAAVQEIVEQVAPSTVVIESRHADRLAAVASGWVLDAEAGLVATNAHVVNGGTSFLVGRGGEARRRAEVVGVAPCEDLAVLRVGDTSGLRSLPLGDQSTLELGETVVAVGYPANASAQASLTSTSGVVSVVRSSYREPALDVPRYPNVVQTDAAINPGNSGGPLVDLNGRLVGVNSAGRTTAPDGRIVQGQSYAIGVERVKEVARVLRTGRSIGWSGLSFDHLSQHPARLGLVVGPVVPGTGAERAGLGKHEGATIVAVNGMPLDSSLASYCDAVAGLTSGDHVTLTLRTPGRSQPQEVKVALE